MLKQESYIQGRLVEVGWRFGQSYSGGHLAGEMIMQVIANRVKCGWGAWLPVLDSVPQFMAENELPPLKHPSIWQPEFVKLLHAVEGIYDGSVPDKANGGLYWADLSKIERPWFLEKIVRAVNPTLPQDGSGLCLPQHRRVADLNSLSFWA
jgi:hypothetical protein